MFSWTLSPVSRVSSKRPSMLAMRWPSMLCVQSSSREFTVNWKNSLADRSLYFNVLLSPTYIKQHKDTRFNTQNSANLSPAFLLQASLSRHGSWYPWHIYLLLLYLQVCDEKNHDKVSVLVSWAHSATWCSRMYEWTNQLMQSAVNMDCISSCYYVQPICFASDWHRWWQAPERQPLASPQCSQSENTHSSAGNVIGQGISA